MNRFGQIATMFGVKLGQEFMVNPVYEYGGEEYKFDERKAIIAKFTEDGLRIVRDVQNIFVEDTDSRHMNDTTNLLHMLICGQYEIVKTKQFLQEGEPCYRLQVTFREEKYNKDLGRLFQDGMIAETKTQAKELAIRAERFLRDNFHHEDWQDFHGCKR